MTTKMKARCVARWIIDGLDIGKCQKCDSVTLVCSDTGEPCPYGGIRDFRALQDRDRNFQFVKATKTAKQRARGGRKKKAPWLEDYYVASGSR